MTAKTDTEILVGYCETLLNPVKESNNKAAEHESLDLPKWDKLISNFDNIIPDGAEEALRRGLAIEHTAWDHWGVIWINNGSFYETVMVYREIKEFMFAPELKQLIDSVNDKYGWE